MSRVGARRQGERVVPRATGVTDGALMRGVRFFGGGMRTSSVIMSLRERHIRFVDTVRVTDGDNIVVEF